jgi:hypothetical protein
MNIGVPRYLIVSMAGLFSAYHIVLGIVSFDLLESIGPAIAAMVLYSAATIMSLIPSKQLRMPMWMAAFNLVVSIVLPLLIGSALDLDREGGTGYATWYVAAVGTLMTITSTRLRPAFAWGGVAFLVVHTAVTMGPLAIVGIGVFGSISWVAVSHILSRAMAKATKDARRFALAEREATDWQAAQEAHVFERQFRLGQTSSMALSMLRHIEATGGELTEEQRAECLHLEGAIRDEIRGRHLLNDDVREQVMSARRRGTAVTLLDEGGLDDLSDTETTRVLSTLADAIKNADADKIIARTVPELSDVAVTVVGLRSTGVGIASDLGQDDESDDEEMALWLEIPRSGS